MKLKDIKPEEFAAAIALIDDEPEKFLCFQTQAVVEVPLIKYLMDVYMHTVESKVPTEASKAALSMVTALYLLEQKAENPEISS